MTQGAYASGVLTAGVNPAFPNTVQGLVKAINYTISKYSKQVYFGWQMNLWEQRSPAELPHLCKSHARYDQAAGSLMAVACRTHQFHLTENNRML